MIADEKFSGVLTPVLTPFKKDLKPDVNRFIKQCQWLLSQNVSLAVFGTNSEANSLAVHEKISLLNSLVEAGINPNSMMPGTGCCSLTESIELTSHAINLGCKGALMLPPFYYKEVSDEGIFRSYSEIIQKIGSEKLKIYLYHIPQVSGVGLSINLIDRLVNEYPKVIAGIKDSSGDWENIKNILDRQWDDFRVFAGTESILLKTMQAGGAGCISATANINPKAIYNLYKNWVSDQAEELQIKLNEIRNLMESYPMIPALKSVVAYYSRHIEWNIVRPPLVSLKKDSQEELLQKLDNFGFNIPGLN
ncbi:uncharacterized protein METZ01_LOCUS119265 [marine metagenome]|uniref:Dihydrodipicolinate synthase family protein n=1 Tax=marine metagenome TaxID=408172 RepID=A0A381XPS6_9ZZZZ